MKPDLELHIDRLVLDGLPMGAAESRQLQASVTAELSRLLAERGLPQGLRASVELPTIDAGQVRLGATARPESVGAKIAQAVYGGFTDGK